METGLRLMAVLAHPDDESLGIGGILARYGAEGVKTYLLTATRGQRGWFGRPDAYPGPAALGKLRQGELEAAAALLGLEEVTFLDYQDGELDQADPAEAAARIAAHIRRIRPDVVVTFDPNGLYGHPDHIAISQLATAAVMIAAGPGDNGVVRGAPHQVAKLYYRTFTQAEMEIYQAAFGDLVMAIDGVERRIVTWPDWAITTRIDTTACWPQVWGAISCHGSQLPGYEALQALPAAYHQQLWGVETYYRALSLVNGGRELETDLFAGLREPVTPAIQRNGNQRYYRTENRRPVGPGREQLLPH